MIRSFKNKKVERFANGERVQQYESFRRQAERKLRILEAATSLNDLYQLRGNRLESLKGKRLCQYSIRINDQWRLCFEWPEDSDGPINVEIVDYHK